MSINYRWAERLGSWLPIANILIQVFWPSSPQTGTKLDTVCGNPDSGAVVGFMSESEEIWTYGCTFKNDQPV